MTRKYKREELVTELAISTAQVTYYCGYGVLRCQCYSAAGTQTQAHESRSCTQRGNGSLYVWRCIATEAVWDVIQVLEGEGEYRLIAAIHCFKFANGGVTLESFLRFGASRDLII